MQLDLRKIWIEQGLYPLMELFKGNRIRHYLTQLQKSNFFPPAKLHDLQKERLAQLLTTCAKHVPAYQRLGLSLEEIQQDPFQVLGKIPILTKSQIQHHPQDFLNPLYNVSQLVPNQTGGSTGKPLRFFMTRVDVEHSEAARWRGLSWWGVGLGSRSLMLWGNPIELTESKQRRMRWRELYLKNRQILSAYTLHEKNVPHYLKLLNRYQPEYLYGYATALFQFAKLLWPHRSSLRLNRLKIVVSTAETLSTEQQDTIEQTFGCPVVNEYGARDVGILAYTCPHGHLHLSAENMILEIVDPLTLTPVPPGQRGLVVVTNLYQDAMPRLRYLLGDTATITQETCACGLTLPILENIEGREDALFQLPDGTLVHGNFLNHLVKKYPSIVQFQLIQTDLYHAQLNVVQKQEAKDEFRAFQADIAKQMPGVCVQGKLCSQISKEASGKFRYAIRQFALIQQTETTFSKG